MLKAMLIFGTASLLIVIEACGWYRTTDDDDTKVKIPRWMTEAPTSEKRRECEQKGKMHDTVFNSCREEKLLNDCSKKSIKEKYSKMIS